jgi:hypothetical protein
MNRDLNVFTRCICKHPLEWHYWVGKEGAPVFDTIHGNRCPDPTCPCSKPQHDGGEPERLKPIKHWPSMWPKAVQ